MILVDASVLITFLRRRNPAIGLLLNRGDMFVCGMTRAEVLHGARDAQDALALTASLDSLQQVPIPEGIWDPLGANLALMRSRGLAVPMPDALLATLGVHYDCEVWSIDQHFTLMQSVLTTLRLFQPSPPPSVTP